MLKRLYFVPDIMDRYRCRSKDTARRYMRQMGAKGTPLCVTEDMIEAFDQSHRRPVHIAKPSWSGKARAVPDGMKIPRRG